MSHDRRQPATRGRLNISARVIVLIGVASLFLVLLGTLTVGAGLAFKVGMGLLFFTLITFILVTYHHRTGPGR